jgi:transposase
MHYVGIDVSQGTLDLALTDRKGHLLESVQIANARKATLGLIKQWKRKYRLSLPESLFCLEPTGHYSYEIVDTLLELQAPTWLAHPMDIKKSQGETRGKSDKVDAERIAQYARRFQDKAKLLTYDNVRLRQLKQLLMKRRQLVKAQTMLQVQLSNVTPRMDKELHAVFKKMDRKHKVLVDKQIQEVDKLIQEQVNGDEQLRHQYDLIITVPGVGPIVASHLLAVTDAFTSFDDPRRLVCHAGAAPFAHSSGSSVRGGTHTSHKSKRSLKGLMTMGAQSVAQYDPEFKAYYERKRAEGKSHRWVINVIIAKVIHRVFAVLRRDEPYLPVDRLVQMT